MLTIGIKRGVSTRGIHHKLIWRHWTYKMPVRYILSSVWVRLSIFAPLSIKKYEGLYAFSLPIPLVIIERIQCIYIYILCLIIIIKSEVWTITHCLGLGHETMVATVCLAIFLFLWHLTVGQLLWSQWRAVEKPEGCKSWFMNIVPKQWTLPRFP